MSNRVTDLLKHIGVNIDDYNRILNQSSTNDITCSVYDLLKAIKTNDTNGNGELLSDLLSNIRLKCNEGIETVSTKEGYIADIQDCITIKEIEEKYHRNRRTFYYKMRSKGIELNSYYKDRNKKIVYYLKSEVTDLFEKE